MRLSGINGAMVMKLRQRLAAVASPPSPVPASQVPTSSSALPLLDQSPLALSPEIVTLLKVQLASMKVNRKPSGLVVVQMLRANTLLFLS